jgi:uncharacterized protein YoxC
MNESEQCTKRHNEIRKAADTRLKDATTRLDSRVGEALAEVKATREEALATVNATMRTLDARAAAIQSDARPVLVNAAALTKDAQDSWDDLYPDMKATVESATVAVTSVAQASEEIRAAAPALAASAVQVGKSAESTSASVAGVALDVKREVDEATRPKKWWQKALGPVYTIGRIAGAFL